MIIVTRPRLEFRALKKPSTRIGLFYQSFYHVIISSLINIKLFYSHCTGPKRTVRFSWLFTIWYHLGFLKMFSLFPGFLSHKSSHLFLPSLCAFLHGSFDQQCPLVYLCHSDDGLPALKVLVCPLIIPALSEFLWHEFWVSPKLSQICRLPFTVISFNIC
jgi:hypothetical protein